MPDLFLDPSDAELIQRYRDGDDDAAGPLFERHHPPAVRLATALAGRSAADDLASEAFVGVLRAIRNGAGPEFAFRPYLLTSVRNGFYRASKTASRVDLYEDVDEAPVPAAGDGVDLREEASLLAQAFATLPERGQAVLWHTTNHDESPEQVAQTLGIRANAVSSLALRAREGLRNAYLTAHLGQTDDPECREVRELLPAYDRGKLRPRALAKVEAHLEHCEDCNEAALMVGGITANLGLLLLPALLGAPGVAAFGATSTAVGAGLVTTSSTIGGSSTAGSSSGSSSSSGAAAGASGVGGLAGAGLGVVAAVAATVLVAAVAVGAALLSQRGDSARVVANDVPAATASPRTTPETTDVPVDEPTVAPSLEPVASTVPQPAPSTSPSAAPTAPAEHHARPQQVPTKPVPTPRPARPDPTPQPTPEPTVEPTPEPTTEPTPEPTPDEDLSISATVESTALERIVRLTVVATRDVPQVTLTFPQELSVGWVQQNGWSCTGGGASRVVICTASGPNPGPLVASWSPPEASGFFATVTSPGRTDPNLSNNTVSVD